VLKSALFFNIINGFESSPEAIFNLLHDAGLSQKAVMEGMSRGAVYVFNWLQKTHQK